MEVITKDIKRNTSITNNKIEQIAGAASHALQIGHMVLYQSRARARSTIATESIPSTR